MTAPRLHVTAPLAPGATLVLPPNAARHVQVLRLQPGAALTLFDGGGGEWAAEVLAIGRKDVSARVLVHCAIECELPLAVTLALGMPANERMDTLVEKATELGVAAIQPLVCERSVLRLAGERADRKAAHWQAVAVAACEQSGRNRVPAIAAPLALRDWLAQQAAVPARRGLLSLSPLAPALGTWLAGDGTAGNGTAGNGTAAPLPVTLLSGPEGGLAPAEITLAEAAGFAPLTLGPRVLRADTAPLAALAALGVMLAAAT